MGYTRAWHGASEIREEAALAEHLKIWDAVEKTDPRHTKTFKRAGGFSGTSVNMTYQAHRATELFGPCGIGWGWTVLDERLLEGAGEARVHRVHIRLWYKWGGERGEIEHFGQTEFSGKRSNGNLFVDEEAPKKSLTDAISKCLSMLGFSADIFLGLYDDNKYVNELKREFSGAKKQPDPEPDIRTNPENRQPPARDDDPPHDGETGEVFGDDRASPEYIRAELVEAETEIEAGLKKKIDKAKSINAVTDLMLHADTQKSLNALSPALRDEVRDHAKKRLQDLGWGKKGAA